MTADKGDGDSGHGQTSDSTINRHVPVRQVISINGEEEDVENINIHDFTTFEQEQLIGPEFISRLKRKSMDSQDGSETKLQRNLRSFRSAVRAVLTTEAIMQAMKHYSHRSDSETEEDEDDSRSPAPTETKSSQFDAGINSSEALPTDNCVSGNPDVPVPEMSAQSVQNSCLPDICEGKPAAVNAADSPLSVKKPDVHVSRTSNGSVAADAVVNVFEVEVANAEAISATRTATDTKGTEATLSSPVVINAEMDVGDGPDIKPVPASEPADVSEELSCDSKVQLDDVDLTLPREVAVTVTTNDGDDAMTVKPTDGLLTENRRTETTDTGCRCCSVQ